jgi:gliding motility-associated-like protein
LGNTVTACYTYPSQVITLNIRDKIVPQAVIAASTTDTLACPGDLITLTGTAVGGEPPLFIQWEGRIAGDPLITLTPLQDTLVRFWVWDNCGDSVEATYNIYVNPIAPISIQVDTLEICAGEVANIAVVASGGSGNLGINWQDGASGATRTVYPNGTTPYVFTVTDGCGQTRVDTAWVVVHPLPNAAFSSVPAVNEKWTYLFEAPLQPNVAYDWDFGDGSTNDQPSEKHTYTLPGQYNVTLTITSDEGCVQTFSKIIDVKSDLILWMADAFTPNGDGVNDYFTVSIAGHESFELLLYNRWGELVFTTTDPNTGWDGNMADGNPAPTGVYVVRIVAILPEKTIHSEIKEITLFR